MKEIKFKVYDKATKESWTSVSLQRFFNNLPESYELVQYTGLKDKNGVEVYQGDILKLNNDSYDPEDTGLFVGLVEVTAETCGFSLRSIVPIPEENNYDSHSLWHVGEGDTTEVIGNIYQHKYLLDNTDTKV